MLDSHIGRELGEFLRLILPLIISAVATQRATSARKIAKRALAACSFPQCGHVCSPHLTAQEGK